MKVRHDEGAANRIGPEPCIAGREVSGEASAGEGTGQPLSREIKIFGVPTLSKRRKATRMGTISRVPRRPGVVREPGMCRRFLHGNREISRSAGGYAVSVCIGKARSRSR